MTEILLGIFWAFTYILIVLAGFKYLKEKQFFMPLVSGALNYAWEIHALRRSGGYWIHIVWLALDCIVLCQNLYFLGAWKKRLLYILSVIASIALIYAVCSIRQVDGMLTSSFVIDIIMACEYLAVARKLSPRWILSIGIFRTIGDFFAWITNLHSSKFVLLAGVVVLFVNLIFLFFALERSRLTSKTNPHSALKAKRK